MNRLTLRQWLPLIGMTLAAFLFNSSEFMPIGLLTAIADTFAISESTAGIMITVYAWGVMLLSLPLMIAASHLSYRFVLLLTLAVFAAGQILSGVAVSYVILILARLVVASAHAVFWSVAAVIAVHLVDASHRDFSISMVATGTSIAMILGLPLGRMIGLLVGWRATFILVGLISIVLFLFQFTVFPQLEQPHPFHLDRLPGLLRNHTLLGHYLIAILFAGGYYTAYSYIEPFMLEVAGISEDWITIALSLFGVAGLLGSASFSWFYARGRARFLRFTTISLTMALVLLRPSAVSLATLLLVCLYWGFNSTAYNVAAQSEIMLNAGADSTVAMSIFSGLFNLGIGLGSFVGGKAVDHLGTGSIGYAGAVLAAGAAIVCVRVTQHLDS